jgi:hypothetical protein
MDGNHTCTRLPLTRKCICLPRIWALQPSPTQPHASASPAAPTLQHAPCSTHLVDHLLHQRVLPGVCLDENVPRICQHHPRLAVPLQKLGEVLAVQLKPAAVQWGGTVQQQGGGGGTVSIAELRQLGEVLAVQLKPAAAQYQQDCVG